MIQKKPSVTNGRLPGGRNTEWNLRGFTVVMCCEKRSSSVGVIMHVMSSESGKTYLFKFCTDTFFGETSMLDIGRGYDG